MIQHDKVEKKQLKDFGILMGVLVPLIFGLLIPFFKRGEIELIPIGIGCIFLLLGLLLPSLLKYPYIFWIKLGEALGWVNSRIILGIVFFLVFTPSALIKKVFGKDSMNRKLDPNASTYRVNSIPRSIQQMEKPF